MTDSAIILSIAVGYLVLSLVVGLSAGGRASRTATGYVAGDRALGTLLMYFITGATIFSAFAFLGGPGKSYSGGAAAFAILAYGTLGFIPFYFLGPRAARVGRAYGFVTQAEMVSTRFDTRAIAGVMAVTSALAFVPYLALQMKGAGYVLFEMTGGDLPRWAGSAIVYSVVLAYVLKSGVMGVGWTNTLQGILMMALAWGFGLYLPGKIYGSVGEMFRQIEEVRPELLRAPGPSGGEPASWLGYTTSVVATALGFSFWPHLFMKAFTAKSVVTLRRTVVLYPTFQLFLVPLLILGFAGVLFESHPAAADQILPHILMRIDASPVLIGLFCAGALAASMSSGDAILHACASILVRDGYGRALSRELDPGRQRFAIRATVVVVLVASYVFAQVSTEDLVGLLFNYAYVPVVQFAPGVVAALYWSRATGRGVLAGLVMGTALSLIFQVWPELKPLDLHTALYGLFLNATIVVALSRRSAGGEAERFLSIAAGSDGSGASGA